MQSMLTKQVDLAVLAKESEAAQKKADKLKEKSSKATGKISTAVSAAEDANQQWESKAPSVFEKLQAVDEDRLHHLRVVLTQFETHVIDQIERNRQTVETCFNALLSVEPADEIKT